MEVVEEGPPSASALPDCVIACVLSSLSTEDLASAELVCACWRRVAAESGAWLALACKRCPELAPLVRDAPICLRADGGTWRPTTLALCKRLAALACAAPPPLRSPSIIAEALAASSTDNPEEHVRNTLSRRTNNPIWEIPAYWSSAGSVRPDAEDWLMYRLAACMCVVTAVRMRPFRAFFQAQQPVYSPLSVRVMLGALGEDAGGYAAAATAGESDEGAYSYTSPDFECTQLDSLQTFTLPTPVVCVGGVLRLQLCGRAQTQASDGRYYVCAAHVRALGTPWYGWEPSANGCGLVFDARSALAGPAAPLVGASSSSDVTSDDDDEPDEPGDVDMSSGADDDDDEQLGPLA